MRLTLRTLLAYMDGILDPNDTQDIGKKVEDSEFATSLVHRISDVMRRLRLGAPRVSDRAPGLDPNSVAEYLDNTLGNEQVADFEKVCLESDVHLAEVASCHQILTLVLGEPAEIDPQSRQNMYRIQDVQTSSQVPPDAPATSAATEMPTLPHNTAEPAEPVVVGGPAEDAADGHASHPKPTVPEYLREPKNKRRSSPLVVALLFMVVLAVAVLYATGQLTPGMPLGNALVHLGLIESPPEPHEFAVRPETTTPGQANAPDTVAPSSEPKEPPRSTSLKMEPNGKTDAPAPVPPAEQALGVKPETKVEGDGRKAPVIDPTTPPPASVATNPEASPKDALNPKETVNLEQPGMAVSGKTDASALPTTKPGADSTASSDKPDEGKTGDAAKSDAVALIPPEDATATGAKPKDAATPNPVEPAAASPEPLGRLLSTDQVLLRDSPETGWVRVATNQMLFPERLLALPTYRAKVSLTAAIAFLEILGGTQLDLLGEDPRDNAGVRVTFGRIVMMPLAKAGTRLRIMFGNRSGLLTFNDAEAVAALEVLRIHQPGENPETEPLRVVADLYAAAGTLSWVEESKESVPLTPSSRLSFDGESTNGPLAVKEVPAWIAGEPLKAYDKMASAPMGQGLQLERSAKLGLKELADPTQRKREIRSLALRSLAYLGEFRTMVAALKDPASKSFWPDYIEHLRDAVARDPETAKAVRLTLEQQYPDQAEELYRMLWGYTNKQLEQGEDAALVDALKNDDSLPVRLLGLWNLKDITGYGGYVYRPEDPFGKRQQGIQGWENRLAKKLIRFRSDEEKPAPVTREKPAAPVTPAAADAPPAMEPDTQ